MWPRWRAVQSVGMTMLSDLQQRKVWEGWLSSEIRANYFADLSSKYHRSQRYATWLTLFSSSGAFITVIAHWAASWLPPILTLLTAGLSFYALVAQNQKNAMDSADLHLRWNKLASGYEKLWDNMYAADAATKLAELDEKGAELSKAATAFPVDESRLLKWEDHVVKHHAAHAST